MKTYRISSNWTLFFVIFIPTMWITFFGSLTLGFLLVDEEELPYFMWGNSFKVGLIVFFLFFLIF
ncbi:MAG: hypothetical protein H6572_09900 [Lewinellaceae bacterium]|nr:hypothetical protein [Lewinellaceae bacterium]